MYSVQSCCIVEEFPTGAAVEEFFEPLLGGAVILPLDCLLVMHTTICRAPQPSMLGNFDARSETIRTPVKYVAGVRMYCSRAQVTLSSRRRRLIRDARSFARPGQQTLFKVAMSPLLSRRDKLTKEMKPIRMTKPTLQMLYTFACVNHEQFAVALLVEALVSI